MEKCVQPVHLTGYMDPERLTLEPSTRPATELLLTKLQQVHDLPEEEERGSERAER